MLPYLIFGVGYGFAAAVQPGQLQAYVVSRTLAQGWRAALPAALAPLISDPPIIVLVLAILIRVPTTLVHVLHLAGGAFLLHLAASAAREWRDHRPMHAPPPGSARRTLLSAAFINLLNPGPYLGWSLVIGPLLLDAWKRSPAHAVALVACFYVAMVLTTAGIVVVFAVARASGPRVTRALLGVSAIALACFGLYQLGSGAVALAHPWRS